MLVASPRIRPSGIPASRAQRTDIVTMAVIPTAWGSCGLVWRNREDESSAPFAERPVRALLCRIWTPGQSVAELRNSILKLYPDCHEVMGEGIHFHPEVVPEWFGEIAQYLQGYYNAALRRWTQPQFKSNWAFWEPRLDWSQLTPFQGQVLHVVAEIPSGNKLTYGQVASKIGKPQASRAVGAAIGANPWPVLVPCHRVIGSSGKLTGFSAPGGIETKRRMLELENA